MSHESGEPRQRRTNLRDDRRGGPEDARVEPRAPRERTRVDELPPVLREALENVRSQGTLPREMRRALASLDFSSVARTASPGRPYGRAVLLEASDGEIMLASWEAGARSAPHDHGGARGVVLVLAGTFAERVFAAGPWGPLTSVYPANECREGDVVLVGETVVHEMSNVAHGARGGLTLHFYVGVSGPLGPARLFDGERRVTVETHGGAWLPADDAIAETPWSEQP
jgi:hypothetical protein